METVFEGVATALVTPFKGEKVDYYALKKLIERQIRLKADAIVLCGTTGEAPTLSDEEHKRILEYGVSVADNKIPVLAGCGSNDTAHAVMMTKFAKSIGAKGALIVTPYYNKTTQNGLIGHYLKIADSVDMPLILYNVPSRTGVNIETKTYLELIGHKNIVGIKEAGNSLSALGELSLYSDKISIYAGNDDSLIPVTLSGGKGVVSILSNVIPDKVSAVYKLLKGGKVAEAKQVYAKYFSLIKELFKEVNPIPVKYALSRLKLCKNILRAPLLKMENTKNLRLELEQLKDDIIL